MATVIAVVTEAKTETVSAMAIALTAAMRVMALNVNASVKFDELSLPNSDDLR